MGLPGKSFLLGVGLFVLLQASGVCQEQEYEGISKPSADVSLAFLRNGIVAKIPLKEGAVVTPQDTVIALDDQLDQVRLKQLKAQAENMLEIEAADAEYKQKQQDFLRIKAVFEKGAISELELDNARLEAQIARLRLQIAHTEHEQNFLKYEEAKVEAAQLILRSPIRGVVEEILVEPGESAQALDPVARIVCIDPLWIDVVLPSGIGRTLRPGQSMQVVFGEESHADAKTASVDHVCVVADAASETIKVRLTLPNPTLRPAGERVRVRLFDSAGEAAP